MVDKFIEFFAQIPVAFQTDAPMVDRPSKPAPAPAVRQPTITITDCCGGGYNYSRRGKANRGPSPRYGGWRNEE